METFRMTAMGEYADDDTASTMKMRDYKDATDLVVGEATPINAMVVRRLTPTECARLQGFPDDYLDIPGAKDGNKYKALGNSMAVPCMAYIGERIQAVFDLMEKP